MIDMYIRNNVFGEVPRSKTKKSVLQSIIVITNHYVYCGMFKVVVVFMQTLYAKKTRKQIHSVVIIRVLIEVANKNNKYLFYFNSSN